MPGVPEGVQDEPARPVRVEAWDTRHHQKTCQQQLTWTWRPRTWTMHDDSDLEAVQRLEILYGSFAHA